jgi:hypothetical protein
MAHPLFAGGSHPQLPEAHALGWGALICKGLQCVSPRVKAEPDPMTAAQVTATTNNAARRAGVIVAKPETDGYMMSTLELWAGLDVEALALSALPNETLSELLRLRGRWPSAGRKPG